MVNYENYEVQEIIISFLILISLSVRANLKAKKKDIHRSLLIDTVNGYKFSTQDSLT
jgi:hypothetical protein